MAGSIVGAGLSLLAGGSQSSSAGAAFGVTEEAIRASIAEQRRQYDQTREDFAPYRETGANALSQYAALYGIGRGGDPDQPEFLDERFQSGTESYIESIYDDYGEGDWDTRDFVRTRPSFSTRQVPNPDYAPGNAFLSRDEMAAARSRFMETPGYQFRMEEGVNALDRSAAARGNLRGGGYAQALTRYAQGVASDEFNNYANRLAGIAGMGQGATQSVATLGQNTANSISNTLMAGAGMQGNALMAAGTARASGFAGAANSINSGMQNILLRDIMGV